MLIITYGNYHHHHHHRVLLLLVEHRASMKSFQALRSPAIPLTSFHDLPVFIETILYAIFYRQSPQNMPDFDNVRPLSAAEIVSRDSRLQLEISHDLPALLGEWYPIRMILVNNEDNRITGIIAHVNLQMNGDESSIEQASKLCYKVARERAVNEEL